MENLYYNNYFHECEPNNEYYLIFLNYQSENYQKANVLQSKFVKILIYHLSKDNLTK